MVNNNLNDISFKCREIINEMKEMTYQDAFLNPVEEIFQIELEKVLTLMSNLCIKLHLTLHAQSNEALKVMDEILAVLSHFRPITLSFSHAGQLVFKEYEALLVSVFRQVSNLADYYNANAGNIPADPAHQIGMIMKAPAQCLSLPLSSHSAAIARMEAELGIFVDAIDELKNFMSGGYQKEIELEDATEGEQVIEEVPAQEVVREYELFLKGTLRAKLILVKLCKMTKATNPKTNEYTITTGLLQDIVSLLKILTILQDDLICDAVEGFLPIQQRKDEYMHLVQNLIIKGKELAKYEEGQDDKSVLWFEKMMQSLTLE